MNKLLALTLFVLLLVPGVSALTVDVLTTDPAPLQAGSFADITLELESSVQEQTYTNLRVGLTETDFIRVISQTDGEFGTFRPGRAATFTFRIFVAEDTPEGFLDLELYAESDTLQRSSYDRRVFVQESDTKPELYIGAIKTTPKQLLPDTDDVTVEVTVQNLGDKDAELVRAELDSEDTITSSYSYSLEDSVATIASGGEAVFTFTLDIDETVRDAIPARLDLRYRTEEVGTSNYQTITESIPFTLEIVKAPFLEIVSVEQQDGFAGGSTENVLRVGIQNTGEAEAEEVRVRIIPDISYPFIFDVTTQYVASTIAPGDTVYVNYEAEVTDEAQDNTYSITTKLESLVGESRYTREDELSIKTVPGESIPTALIAGAVIAIVLVLAVIIGIRARKRK